VAVRIRLRRTGRKNLPSYRIGVFDGRTRRDGPAIEIVGWFNPLMREAGKGFKVQADRIEEWVRRGAKMTMAVTELLDRQGVKLAARPVKAAPAKAKTAKAPAAKGAPKSGALKRKADPAAVARKKRKLAKRESRRAWKAKKLAAAAAKTAAAAAPAPAAGA
jgi:small subunit ribosomal protein S16